MNETFLGAKRRFKSPPTQSLIDSAFSFELEAAEYLYPELHFVDLAHIATLYHSDVLQKEIFEKLKTAIFELKEIPDEQIQFDPAVGDVYNNRDLYLKQLLGKDSGYLHIGRSRREACTLAWILACRSRVAGLLPELASLLSTLSLLIEDNKTTLMSDFTYLQHAQPTTLGHYLLGFALPLVRDVDRLKHSLSQMNISPAGTGSMNGSMIPMDRNFIAELLGFESVQLHGRDAMWAPDIVADIMLPMTTIMTTLSRLAEELIIWTTTEFNYIQFGDEVSRTSVIMPHKKNPYGLAFIRGQARFVLGQVNAIQATSLTPSGQPDNRIFAYSELPKQLDMTKHCLKLMSDVLVSARVNKENLNSAAQDGFITSTDICDFLVLNSNMDNRSAHDLIGLAVRNATERGLEQLSFNCLRGAASELALNIDVITESVFENLTNPDWLVSARKGIGSAACEQVVAMNEHVAESILGITVFQTDYPMFFNFERFFTERYPF